MKVTIFAGDAQIGVETYMSQTKNNYDNDFGFCTSSLPGKARGKRDKVICVHAKKKAYLRSPVTVALFLNHDTKGVSCYLYTPVALSLGWNPLLPAYIE